MLLIITAETVGAGFFLARSRPTSVSVLSFDWFVAVAGTFVPLLLRPADFDVFRGAGHAMVVGLLLQILALLC